MEADFSAFNAGDANIVCVHVSLRSLSSEKDYDSVDYNLVLNFSSREYFGSIKSSELIEFD